MILPNCENTELTILAACFNSMTHIPEIRAEYFYSETNRKAYESILDGIYTPMAGTGVTNEIYFKACDYYAGSEVSEPTWKRLIDLYYRRKSIIEKRKEISRLADLSEDISDMGIYTHDEKWIFNKEEMAKVTAEAKKNFKPINTGFANFDKRAVSFSPGHVWYMAGRTGTLKTALALQILAGICKNHAEEGMFFSMEMPEGDLGKRAHSIDYYSRKGSMWCSDEIGLRKDCEIDYRLNYSEERAMSVLPDGVSYCTKPGLSVYDIRNIVAKEQKKSNLRTIVIDYLQIMKGPFGDEYKDVSYNAVNLKNLAKEMNVRVICLSQLSRDAKDGTQEVYLNNLRGSGHIEEAADFITGQWRPEDNMEYVYMKNMKGRNGAFLCRYVFMTDGTFFREPSEQELQMIQ